TYVEDYIEQYRDYSTGLALAVIKDDETVYKKYYGKSDIANNIDVSDESVFEWGSVSKLFVWTSVMQLYEKKKIDLNSDIRTYLPKKFLTKLNYNKKITMLNLMNHNAGWQEITAEGVIEEDGSKVENLAEFLKKNEPVQVYKPGEVCSYSNWGTTLAALIVERVSGKSYSDYVHKNILEPLKMKHTSILDDYSDNNWVRTQMQYNKGYYLAFDESEMPIFDENGKNIFNEVKHYQIALYPAGAVTGTLDDFIKFAKEFTKDEKSVLFKKCKTMDKFLSSSLNYENSDINRISHGLWTIECKNQLLGHYGNTTTNSSGLMFDTKTDTAYVVMTNQASEKVYNYIMLDMIFGTVNQRELINEQNFIDTNIVAGNYLDSRIQYNNYDSEEFANDYSINVSSFTDDRVLCINDIFSQYEPGFFVSDLLNWSFFYTEDTSGYGKINFYTEDLLNYNYIQDIMTNVEFTDFSDINENIFDEKIINKFILKDLKKHKDKCKYRNIVN
ncbi:MAG: serine hydrolase domain-containing protein, partial [Clostridiales bacterium]